MPTLNIEGRKVTVDDSFLKLSPEQQNATVQEIHSSFAASAPKTAEPHIDTVTDAAKGFDSGVSRMVAGIGGIVGDATDLGATGIHKATNFVERKLGMPESPAPDRTGSILNAIPTSKSMQDTIQRDYYGGAKPYEAQTGVGKVAQTIGEYSIGAAGGAGGLVRRGLTQVAAPALANEAAGKLTEGTAAEPYARVAAALAAAGGASRFASPAAPKTVAPARDALKDAYDTNYAAAKNLGVELHPSSMQYAADRIKHSVVDAGYRDVTAPKTMRLIDELAVPISKTGNLDDVEAVRKALGKAAADPAEKDAARRAINGIDDYLANLTVADVAKGDAAKASKLLTDARGNYAAGKRSDTIQEAIERAERAAGSAGSGTNIDNALRQQIKSIRNSDKKSRGFSAEELEAMDKIIAGSTGGNIARLIGKLAPTGVVSGGFSGGAGFAAAGPAGAVAVPAIGYGAKKVADAITRRQIQALDNQVRTRAPLQSSIQQPPMPVGINAKRAAVAQALLAARIAHERAPVF